VFLLRLDKAGRGCRKVHFCPQQSYLHLRANSRSASVCARLPLACATVASVADQEQIAHRRHILAAPGGSRHMSIYLSICQRTSILLRVGLCWIIEKHGDVCGRNLGRHDQRERLATVLALHGRIAARQRHASKSGEPRTNPNYLVRSRG
jgi:hypothetical protein